MSAFPGVFEASVGRKCCNVWLKDYDIVKLYTDKMEIIIPNDPLSLSLSLPDFFLPKPEVHLID